MYLYKLIGLMFCITQLMPQHLTSAALARLLPQKKPAEFADQEGCYQPNFNMVIATNASYYPKDEQRCEVYTCQEGGETLIESCGVIAVEGNCRILPQDYSLDYPKCCKQVVCTKQPAIDEPTPLEPTPVEPTPVEPITKVPIDEQPTGEEC